MNTIKKGNDRKVFFYHFSLAYSQCRKKELSKHLSNLARASKLEWKRQDEFKQEPCKKLQQLQVIIKIC